MPSRRDFGQDMCGKPPARYASPEGGSDPFALEPPDRPIHTQCIRNPVWNGLITHGAGIAGRYSRLPSQYVPQLAEYPELSDRKF